MPAATILAPFVFLFAAAVLTAQGERIEWQRSLADALAEQRRTGLPLLIAVNTQGEVFNDRFAATTYLDPAFVELTRGYVCVVASPDRHNESDYDAFGNRIECPRFPGCTCAEHIAIEPLLYERWFEGTRAAPRHIAVGPDGTKLFDRYLDNSMQTAIDAIRRHRGAARAGADPLPRTVAALLQRRDAAARRALEERFRAGDTAQRVELLAAAGEAASEPFDLLRMGLRADAEPVFAAAAASLAQVATTAALIDLEDALARTDDEALQARLVARLDELGKTDRGAARLRSHFDRDREARLQQPWRNAWAPAAFDAADRGSIEGALDRAEARLRSDAGDRAARLLLATAQVALGLRLAADGGKNVDLWLADGERSARSAGDDAETAAVAAVARWHRGDAAGAEAACAQALASANSDRTPDAWLATQFLGVLVQSTTRSAYARAEAEPLASLRGELVRVELALTMLAAREATEETTFLTGLGLLEFAGRRRDARRQLGALVDRFPASALCHERWRTRLLVDLGAEPMRAAYGEFVGRSTEPAAAEWFAGYAALVAGEQHTRDRRGDVGVAAYGEAVDRFVRSGADNPDYADSAHHFAVLALAGRAHLRHAAGDDEGAVADLLRAAAMRPASLDAEDGLLRKPRGIAGRIARSLRAAGKEPLAQQLQPILP